MHRYSHIVTTVLIFCLVGGGLSSCRSGEEKIPVSYIYASHCNTCGEAEKRMEVLEKSYRKAGGKPAIEAALYNVLIDSQYEPAMAILDGLDIPASARNLPLLISGKAWFYGEEDIEKALDSLESGLLP